LGFRINRRNINSPKLNKSLNNSRIDIFKLGKKTAITLICAVKVCKAAALPFVAILLIPNVKF
jgi:hypothetical protein